MADILNLDVKNENSLKDILHNNPFYIDIKGSVNICLIRCGQNIEQCNNTTFSTMTNYGKILVLKPDKSNNGKCSIKLAFDTSNDNTDSKGNGDYKFTSAFFTVPSLHRLNGQICDMETFLLFSSVQSNGNILYACICTLNNATNTVPLDDKLINYKLLNELFSKNNSVPDMYGTSSINGSPNPVDLNNFIPVEGSRNFYDYTHPSNNKVNFRVFQNILSISNETLTILKSKLTPGNIYTNFKNYIEKSINPPEGLFFYFSEDLTNRYKSFASNKNIEKFDDEKMKKLSDSIIEEQEKYEEDEIFKKLDVNKDKDKDDIKDDIIDKIDANDKNKETFKAKTNKITKTQMTYLLFVVFFTLLYNLFNMRLINFFPNNNNLDENTFNIANLLSDNNMINVLIKNYRYKITIFFQTIITFIIMALSITYMYTNNTNQYIYISIIVFLGVLILIVFCTLYLNKSYIFLKLKTCYDIDFTQKEDFLINYINKYNFNYRDIFNIVFSGKFYTIKTNSESLSEDSESSSILTQFSSIFLSRNKQMTGGARDVPGYIDKDESKKIFDNNINNYIELLNNDYVNKYINEIFKDKTISYNFLYYKIFITIAFCIGWFLNYILILLPNDNILNIFLNTIIILVSYAPLILLLMILPIYNKFTSIFKIINPIFIFMLGLIVLIISLEIPFFTYLPDAPNVSIDEISPQTYITDKNKDTRINNQLILWSIVSLSIFIVLLLLIYIYFNFPNGYKIPSIFLILLILMFTIIIRYINIPLDNRKYMNITLMYSILCTVVFLFLINIFAKNINIENILSKLNNNNDLDNTELSEESKESEESLHKRIKELEALLSKKDSNYEGEYAKLSEKFLLYKEQIKGLEALLNKKDSNYEEEYTKLSEKFLLYKEQIKGLEALLNKKDSNYEEEYTKLSEEFLLNKERIKGLEALLNEKDSNYKGEYVNLSKKYIKLSNELLLYQNLIKDLEALYKKDNGEDNKLISELENEIKELRNLLNSKLISELENEIKELENENNKYNEISREISNDSLKLYNEILILNEKLKLLEKYLHKDKTEDALRLHTELLEKNKKLKLLEISLQNITEKMNFNKNKIEELKNNIENIKNKYELIKGKNLKLHHEILDRDTKIKLLENALKNVTEKCKLEYIQKEYLRKITSYDDIISEINKLKDEINNLNTLVRDKTITEENKNQLKVQIREKEERLSLLDKYLKEILICFNRYIQTNHKILIEKEKYNFLKKEYNIVLKKSISKNKKIEELSKMIKDGIYILPLKDSNKEREEREEYKEILEKLLQECEENKKIFQKLLEETIHKYKETIQAYEYKETIQAHVYKETILVYKETILAYKEIIQKYEETIQEYEEIIQKLKDSKENCDINDLNEKLQTIRQTEQNILDEYSNFISNNLKTELENKNKELKKIIENIKNKYELIKEKNLKLYHETLDRDTKIKLLENALKNVTEKCKLEYIQKEYLRKITSYDDIISEIKELKDEINNLNTLVHVETITEENKNQLKVQIREKKERLSLLEAYLKEIEELSKDKLKLYEEKLQYNTKLKLLQESLRNLSEGSKEYKILIKEICKKFNIDILNEISNTNKITSLKNIKELKNKLLSIINNSEFETNKQYLIRELKEKIYIIQHILDDTIGMDREIYQLKRESSLKDEIIEILLNLQNHISIFSKEKYSLIFDYLNTINNIFKNILEIIENKDEKKHKEFMLLLLNQLKIANDTKNIDSIQNELILIESIKDENSVQLGNLSELIEKIKEMYEKLRRKVNEEEEEIYNIFRSVVSRKEEYSENNENNVIAATAF